MNEPSMRDVMTPSPITIEPGATVAEAQALMRRHAIRHLPVVSGSKLVGVVSERDLFFMEALAGAHRELVDVSEAMSAQVYTTTPDAKLRVVARVMTVEKYGSAVVMDGDRIAGIFTVTDALRHIVDRLA